MIKTKKSAILYSVLLSAALLVPTALVLVTNHNARSSWEGRALDKLPTISEVVKNPKAGFKQFDGFMNDHVGLGLQAIKLRRKMNFKALGVTGDKYIVSNSEGAYFLTAPFMQVERGSPFQWFGHNCNALVTDKITNQYRIFTTKSEAVLSKFGAKVIFTAVPTKSVLLADNLPKSTPQSIVESCKKIDAQNNGMMKVSRKLPDFNFYYPYDLFKARTKEDPKFFPNTAYHWAGESNWAFIEDFAKKENLSLSQVWPKGPCIPKKVRWDLGKLIGVETLTDGCNRDVRELRLEKNSRYGYPLNPESKFETVNLFALTNPYSANDKNAVLISNSFGPLVREQFASLFKTTYHVNLNALNDRDLKLLLHESDIMDVDYVVVIVADFHYPNFLGPIK